MPAEYPLGDTGHWVMTDHRAGLYAREASRRAGVRRRRMDQKIGPVQLLAIGFDEDARFEGRIMDELANLERQETIRILDLLFVGKDAETGDLLALDYQGEELGAIVGALLGFDFEGEEPSEVTEFEGH